MTRIRSSLYVPGDRPERFDKAVASGADSIILDLEDAVAEEHKAEARENIRAWLMANSGAGAWIRVNNRPDMIDDDLAMAASVPCLGVVMAKADPASCAAPALDVVALVESAEGVGQLDEIASLGNVVRLAIGEADLAADLGMSPSPDGREFAPIRSAMVVASARFGLLAPTGPVPTYLDDDQALRATSEELQRQGFGGRSVIHPKQVAIVNVAFAPSAGAIEWANKVLAASAEGGAAVAVDGEFVDAAVLRRAHGILSRAGGP